MPTRLTLTLLLDAGALSSVAQPTLSEEVEVRGEGDLGGGRV